MIRVHRNGGNLEVAVQDNGEGIEGSETGRIFQSFYQPAGHQSSGGRLGLGLSIAKEIVHSHGGKIWVESKGVGKGAVFTFTLPLKT